MKNSQFIHAQEILADRIFKPLNEIIMANTQLGGLLPDYEIMESLDYFIEKESENLSYRQAASIVFMAAGATMSDCEQKERDAKYLLNSAKLVKQLLELRVEYSAESASYHAELRHRQDKLKSLGF
jgi:hypothetical protein